MPLTPATTLSLCIAMGYTLDNLHECHNDIRGPNTSGLLPHSPAGGRTGHGRLPHILEVLTVSADTVFLLFLIVSYRFLTLFTRK